MMAMISVPREALLVIRDALYEIRTTKEKVNHANIQTRRTLSPFGDSCIF